METLAPPTETRRPPKSKPIHILQPRDFVWAKIKAHPWWPGRICDPSQQPPDQNHNHHLVALYGTNYVASFDSSQLKPFKLEFKNTINHTGPTSKLFTTSINNCLDDVEKEALTVSEPQEFLDCLKDAACEFVAVDMLDTAVLRGWVHAFGTQNRRLVGSIVDFVDKEDVVCAVESKRRVVKGPEITELPSPRRKKRSMAELVGVEPMDALSGVYKLELASPRKHENYAEVAVEGRRERKKSKYLSPPYTHVSGYNKRDDSEADRDGEATGVDEDSEKEEEKMSPLVRYADTPVNVLLVELLYAASDPLHLKWNRLAKAIRSFFTEFRSSVCSGDPGDNQKELDCSGSAERQVLKSYMADERKEGDKGVEFADQSNGLGDLSLGSDKRITGRRTQKDQDTGGTPTSLNLGLTDVSKGKRGRPRKKTQDAAPGETVGDLDANLNGGSEEGRSIKKSDKSEGEANGGAVRELGHRLIHCSELVKLQEKRKRRDKGYDKIQVSSDHTVTNGKETRTRQKTRIEEGNVTSATQERGPLLYIRENLEKLISTLTEPSFPKNNLVSEEGLKPEVRKSLVGDMQGILNKVNNLLTDATGISL